MGGMFSVEEGLVHVMEVPPRKLREMIQRRIENQREMAAVKLKGNPGLPGAALVRLKLGGSGLSNLDCEKGGEPHQGLPRATTWRRTDYG